MFDYVLHAYQNKKYRGNIGSVQQKSHVHYEKNPLLHGFCTKINLAWHWASDKIFQLLLRALSVHRER